MARVGEFFSGITRFGDPLSVVHPIDNEFPKYDPELLAEQGLTERQRQRLQEQIDELYAVLVASRDYRM